MAIWKTLICLCLVNMVSMISLSEAREFDVSWQIPSPSNAFEKWSQINRFLIGDSIVFKYDSKKDSVLEVNESDYKTCNKSNPIKSHNDGNSAITLGKSGLFFFISGAEGHCDKAQKLEIRVLAATHHRSSPAPTPAHAPAPHNGGAALSVGFLGGAAAAFIAALF